MPICFVASRKRPDKSFRRQAIGNVPVLDNILWIVIVHKTVLSQRCVHEINSNQNHNHPPETQQCVCTCLRRWIWILYSQTAICFRAVSNRISSVSSTWPRRHVRHYTDDKTEGLFVKMNSFSAGSERLMFTARLRKS